MCVFVVDTRYGSATIVCKSVGRTDNCMQNELVLYVNKYFLSKNERQ